MAESEKHSAGSEKYRAGSEKYNAVSEKYKKVLDRLQTLCSKRECCRSDVRKKALAALDGDGEAADGIVESLVADRFLDDLRYASAFAREKAALTGWGGRKIEFALLGKGIDRSTIAKALENVDSGDASRKLTSVLAAKYRSLKDDPQAKLKLIRFALGRGYEYDDICEAVELTINGDE